MNPEMDYREVLQQAHDRAIASRPENPKTKEEFAERKRRADAAKRAASINVGRSRVGTATMTPKSIRESLEAAYDRIHGN